MTDTLPVALALVEHLNLTEDTTAAVTWSLLNDLEQKNTLFQPQIMQKYKNVCDLHGL